MVMTTAEGTSPEVRHEVACPSSTLSRSVVLPNGPALSVEDVASGWVAVDDGAGGRSEVDDGAVTERGVNRGLIGG